MQISNDFYLSGFTRQDKGEAGAVFLRREAPKESAQEPSARKAVSFGEKVIYEIALPKPPQERVTGCAVVTRSSKNCYSATVYDERRIATFKESSLCELRRTVAAFFGV